MYYQKCHCGADCIYKFDNIDTCAGGVNAVDEVEDMDGWVWVHVCEKHNDRYNGI